MSERHKRTIVLDLMGVIFREGLYVTDILYPRIKKIISYPELKKRYVLFAVGNISRQEFWDGIIPRPRVEAFEKSFLRGLKMQPGASRTLAKLQQKYRLILFSEIPEPWGNFLLKRHRLRSYFSKILLSGAAKKTKPFASFFRELSSEIQTKDGIIFVDDAPENLMAARRFHLHPVLFARSKEKQKNKRGFSSIIRLENLLDSTIWNNAQ